MTSEPTFEQKNFSLLATAAILCNIFKSSLNYFCLCIHLKILVLRSTSYLAKVLIKDTSELFTALHYFTSYFCNGDDEVLQHDLIV